MRGNGRSNNPHAAARMCRLICYFVIRIWHKTGFLMTSLPSGAPRLCFKPNSECVQMSDIIEETTKRLSTF